MAAATCFTCLSTAPAAAQAAELYWRTLRAERRPAVVLASAAPETLPAPLGEALRLFRVHEMTDDAGLARRALALLRRAEPADEYRAWHALAMAMILARGPSSRLRDIGDDDDWYVDVNSLGSAHSLRLLRAALELDPGLREAALELATWALDREHPVVAAEADIALADLAPDADVQLARARLNLLLGDFGRAADLAAAAERSGADASRARHVRARALLQSPATTAAGVAAYLDGARVLTAEGRAAYSRGLEPILSEEEAAAWRAQTPATAAAWLGRFWRRNAARAGVMPDERLAEHYRRVHAARVDFPLDSPLSVLQIQARFAIREDSRRFGLSLRGLMLVRHGDPFRLAHLERCLSNPWPGPGPATICPMEYGPDRLAAFQQGARLAEGDSFDPFARPLAFAWGVYAFRGAAGGTDLVFAVGLPERSANALIDGSGGIAGLLSAIVLPDSGEVVRRDDPFRSSLPSRVVPVEGQGGALSLLHTTLALPRGESAVDYRVTVSDLARHAGGTAGARLELPALDGFSLSDLVVAPTDAAGTWRRGDVTVPLAPLRVYRPDESFRLYYEVYGLAEDTPYRTEIALLPADGMVDRLRELIGRERVLRLRFEGRSPAPHAIHGAQELRTIDLDGLDPGLWTLRVTVTDLATGGRATRETTLDVVSAS